MMTVPGAHAGKGRGGMYWCLVGVLMQKTIFKTKKGLTNRWPLFQIRIMIKKLIIAEGGKPDNLNKNP